MIQAEMDIGKDMEDKKDYWQDATLIPLFLVSDKYTYWQCGAKI